VARLDPAGLAARRWSAARGKVPTGPLELAHAFLLPDRLAAGGVAVLALVDVPLGRRRDRYLVPLVADEREPAGLREAGAGDGAWRALAALIAQGVTLPALVGPNADRDARPGPVAAALVCRPSPALADLGPERLVALAAAEERPLGRDPADGPVVLGERLVVRAYRRVQPGLSPDLELTAYLSEEAGFPGVPRLAGWAEVVARDAGAATVATLQAYVASAEDADEVTAERLADLILAPGPVSLEWATEVAADLGSLVAGLHVALASPPANAPDLAPRDATRDEVRAWRRDALARLDEAVRTTRAVDRATGAILRDWAPEIAARLSRFEALARTPRVMRIHADLHLGRVLVADDGYRVIGFDGDPLRTVEARRRPDSPLRDVASMLRSLDRVAREATRRAERRHRGAVPDPRLDTEAWVERARERFLAAYAAGVREAGVEIDLDLDLLDAFEVANQTHELAESATSVPSRLEVPREGMAWLLGRAATR
jgi:maltose alpha-D-glucosyltransferase/alpha-amylase